MELSADFIRRFNNPFSALRHRNFRFYWGGMCISLIGTWMQNIALPWLAYSMTESPFLLSLVSALQFTPMLLFSLFAGVIVDRFPKKNILYFTQSAALLITLALAILVWSGHVRYWHLLLLATMLGMVNTLDMPTRQSFIIELVGREDLMNAIALNSSVFNMARVIGPAVAGVVMATMGIAFCFYINSLSFAAVLIGLFFIHPLVEYERAYEKGKILADIKDGLKYIVNNEHLLNTIITVAIVGVFAMNFNVLVPVFTKEVLGQEEAVFAFLMSMAGLGSFGGAMLIATMSRSGPQRFVLNVVPLFIAAMLILTGLTNQYAITGLCLAAAGLFFVAFISSANSSLQLNSTDDYRGRVISVYMLIFGGSVPLGNIYSGVISDHFGSRAGFIACGGVIFILLGIRRFIKGKVGLNRGLLY